MEDAQDKAWVFAYPELLGVVPISNILFSCSTKQKMPELPTPQQPNHTLLGLLSGRGVAAIQRAALTSPAAESLIPVPQGIKSFGSDAATYRSP